MLLEPLFWYQNELSKEIASYELRPYIFVGSILRIAISPLKWPF